MFPPLRGRRHDEARRHRRRRGAKHGRAGRCGRRGQALRSRPDPGQGSIANRPGAAPRRRAGPPSAQFVEGRRTLNREAPARNLRRAYGAGSRAGAFRHRHKDQRPRRVVAHSRSWIRQYLRVAPAYRARRVAASHAGDERRTASGDKSGGPRVQRRGARLRRHGANNRESARARERRSRSGLHRPSVESERYPLSPRRSPQFRDSRSISGFHTRAPSSRRRTERPMETRGLSSCRRRQTSAALL